MTKFGILSKFIFLQDIAAIFVSKLNPAVTHNVEKYRAIQKAFYLSALDQLEGDYYEFGVYAGSSITCAIRCAKSLRKYDAGLAKCCFFGFDSFLGFGEVDNSEKHSFYNDENFKFIGKWFRINGHPSPYNSSKLKNRTKSNIKKKCVG